MELDLLWIIRQLCIWRTNSFGVWQQERERCFLLLAVVGATNKAGFWDFSKPASRPVSTRTLAPS